MLATPGSHDSLVAVVVWAVLVVLRVVVLVVLTVVVDVVEIVGTVKLNVPVGKVTVFGGTVEN
jgi:hypothetical protein